MLGAPLFEQIEVKFPDGREIRIDAQSTKPGAFLNRVTLNGEEVGGTSIPHSAFLKDARLGFSAT